MKDEPILELPFRLDQFQIEAIDHLRDGKSVVVAAPTGAGKTVVADHAIELACRAGKKAFYTTPIKALSNQKYHDLLERYGPEKVGLLTGDVSLNGRGQVVVMTTEVLRNMLYARSRDLVGLGVVVLDEVHYLQDRYRGPVWEEVLVHTPAHVAFVCLSATVSNADQLTEWISSVRGPTELIEHHERPVELTNLYLSGDTEGQRLHLIETLVDGRANAEGHRYTESPTRQRNGRSGKRRFKTPRRAEVLSVLADAELLPAIVFIFSRAGCDDAASALVDSGSVLTTVAERSEIAAIVARHTAHMSVSERTALGLDRFSHRLQSGIGAHHAGMVPAFKEAVEACFVRGLVKLVFATETLALGINMPAKAVVIERLTKFNGDTHEFLTPLEYTQLTGRAGRRGIDEHGSAIVLWSPYVRFGQVAELASSRRYELESAFTPTYNMAANLVAMHDRNGCHELLDRSFAQFQADRRRRRLDRRLERVSGDVAELEGQLHAAGLDPAAVLVATANGSTSRGGGVLEADVSDSLARLDPGDVITIVDGDRTEPAAVLSVAYRSKGFVKVRLVGRSHKRYTLGPSDFAVAPDTVGHVTMPEPYQPNNGAYQHEVVKRLQRQRLKRRRKAESSRDPVDKTALSGLDDESRSVLRELVAKRAQQARIETQIATQEGKLSSEFDNIVGILQARGYISDWSLTDLGEMLTAIFNESDMVVAEGLRMGLFDGLSSPEVASLLSCVTYSHRGPEAPARPRFPSATLSERFRRLDDLVADLRADEAEAGVRQSRELDPGFAGAAYAWASGADLGAVMGDEELTGGDFVRQVRLLNDVLGQLARAAPGSATRRAAASAAAAIDRGVVVAAGMEAITDGATPTQSPSET